MHSEYLSMEKKDFSVKEILFLKKLNTPLKIQEFIDKLEYNKGRRVSVVDVLRQKKADCLEAACFTYYVLTLNGFNDKFIMDLEAAYHDHDHVICVFKLNGLYGAVAQSNYLGLRYKNPVYKNLRELSMSYFEHYFSFSGALTLKKRSIPLKPEGKDSRWISSRKEMYALEEKLRVVKHYALIPKNLKLPKVRKIIFEKEQIELKKQEEIERKEIEKYEKEGIERFERSQYEKLKLKYDRND